MSAPQTSDLIIRVSGGSGVGPTRLAAFDHALREAGVADFNLVRLSSIIPPQAEVVEVKASDQIAGGHGDLLYCVYADAYASTPGEEAWAGVAWATAGDGTGAGLFVEHHGSSEASVRRDLRATLDSMIAGRDAHYEHTAMVVSSALCVDHPVSAVVLATYRAVAWDWPSS